MADQSRTPLKIRKRYVYHCCCVWLPFSNCKWQQKILSRVFFVGREAKGTVNEGSARRGTTVQSVKGTELTCWPRAPSRPSSPTVTLGHYRIQPRFRFCDPTWPYSCIWACLKCTCCSVTTFLRKSQMKIRRKTATINQPNKKQNKQNNNNNNKTYAQLLF